MQQTRQLAAIIPSYDGTDIVRYTALMGKDEQRAFELLKQALHVAGKLRKDSHFQDLLDRVGFPPN